MYTLVVVDMQPGFEAANGERVGKNCLREIKEAVRVGAHIVFLEFVGHGETLPELTAPVSDYPFSHAKTKFVDDGSPEVQQAIKERGFMIGRFRVIGINTDWCVRSTVEGLRKRFPNSFVEVVIDACWSDSNHFKGVRLIRKIENVDVI
jgi:nicotinamidase-related amidase